jgi:hypothetical protein
MAESEIERRLRDAGAEFIESHRTTAGAIRDAADAGMSAGAISLVSGLSPETVSAFLRSSED